mgnify:CR=1 FL=1
MREARGKPCALIEFLPGISIDEPETGQAHAVGVALADLHLASSDFPQSRASSLSIPICVQMLRDNVGRFDEIDPRLAAILPDCGTEILELWPADLPEGTIHSDLFPDNVLFVDDRVTGLIDFYFACSGLFAYDLVTRAAAGFRMPSAAHSRCWRRVLACGLWRRGWKTGSPHLPTGSSAGKTRCSSPTGLHSTASKAKPPSHYERRSDFHRRGLQG